MEDTVYTKTNRNQFVSLLESKKLTKIVTKIVVKLSKSIMLFGSYKIRKKILQKYKNYN